MRPQSSDKEENTEEEDALEKLEEDTEMSTGAHIESEGTNNSQLEQLEIRLKKYIDSKMEELQEKMERRINKLYNELSKNNNNNN